MLTEEFQYLKAGYRSSYAGSGHVGQDIGLIKRTWGSWTSTTSSDWRRFNYYSNTQLTGTRLATYGAGVYLRTGELDGNLRSGSKPVGWNSSYGFFSTYGGIGGTFCRGDSGGPGLTYSGLYGRSGVVASLQSWSTASDGACTAEGALEHNTPTAGNHNFILEFIAGTGCNSYRTKQIFHAILGRSVY